MQIKRRCTRWQVNKEAKLKLEGAENYAACMLHDISFVGAKVSLPLKLPPDTFLKLSLVLKDDITLDVQAWVVWCKTIDCTNCYAIYFSKITDQDKEKIYKFVYSQVPKEVTKNWWCMDGASVSSTTKGGEHMEDRRIFQRFSIRFPMRFLDLKRNIEGFAETLDISAKGIGFKTSMAVEAGTPMEIWMQLPDKGEPLYTRGQVVWTQSGRKDEWHAGVNLEKADLMGLSRILR